MEAPEDEEKEADMEIVRKALDILTEHFDAVHVFCSRHEGEWTRRINLGSGNYWTRYGVVRGWITEQEAILKQEATENDEEHG